MKVPVHPLPGTCPTPWRWKALVVAGLALLVVAPARAALSCPPKCASISSVVHAAGVPPGVRQVIDELAFDGAVLAPSASAVPGRLAAELKALPPRAVVSLQVGADAGLAGAAAKRQAAARVQALRAALDQAGVPARQVKLSAR